jgi:putative copper export protein
VLAVHLDTVRLFLHVLAATVWVGGQLTLVGLLPSLRTLGPDTPRTVARAFNRVAWPAFGVLVATGIRNVLAASPSGDVHYDATLAAKIVVVALSGTGAFVHTVARSRRALAVWGAISGTAALVALFLGVLLASR